MDLICLQGADVRPRIYPKKRNARSCLFICKVSMLFSYSRDATIFVYFFLGSFYAYKQGGVRLRIHPRKAMLKLCFFKKLKVGKFIAYQVRQ